MSRRVVVTGLGVIAPNGNGLAEFEAALRKGRSGLHYNTWDLIAQDANAWAARVQAETSAQAHVLSPGQSFEL